MSRVLLSGFRVRVLDANGNPDVYPSKIVFTDGTTTFPKAVYSGPLLSDPALGTEVALDAQGFGPAAGIWLGVGTYNMEVTHNVGETLIPNWRTIWTTDGIQGGSIDSSNDDTSIRFVNTVPDIRGLTTLGGLTINLGYYNLNDGGQGQWRWVATSMEVDDGGAYLIPTGQSISAPGRWHRIIPSGGEVDVRMWGCVTNTPDVSGNIELAQQWCARTDSNTGITLAFPAGVYNISTADLTLYDVGTTMTGASKPIAYHIYNGCQFGGGTGGKLRFSAPTQIDTFQQLAYSPIELFFSQNSVPYVRTCWFGGGTDKLRLQYADAIGLPIYINELVSYTVAQTVTNKVILGPASNISAYAMITFNGGLEVQGDPRIVLGVGVGGNYIINQTEINAWWFGYGSLPGNDQAVALTIGMNCASYSTATLQIDSIPNGKGIYSQCGIEGNTYQCRISGIIDIYDGANLYLPNVQADRKQIFHFNGTPSLGPVSIAQGVIYPEWFGAQPNSGYNCNTAFKYMMQTFQRSNTPHDSIRWIDGGGNSYTVTDTIYMTVGSIGLRDMQIISTTQTASTNGCIYMGGSPLTTTYELRDVSISHVANGERRPTIMLDTVADVNIRNCRINSNHGIVFSTKGSSRVNINDNIINMSNGAILYANPTLTADSSNFEMYNNTVYGINNTVYGTSATVQTLPALFSNIYNNKFISQSGTTPTTITFCRDSTLDVSNTGQVTIHHNLFMGINLAVRTKGFVTIEKNDFRATETSIAGNIVVTCIVSDEIVSSPLRITSNNAIVSGDWSAGYINTNPATFAVEVCGNYEDAHSICTHKTTISQATLAAYNNGKIVVRRLFPNAQITSFQMSLLAINNSVNNVRGYSPILAQGVSQNAFPTANAAGTIEVETTGATWNGDGRDWVQWSIDIGSSYYHNQR